MNWVFNNCKTLSEQEKRILAPKIKAIFENGMGINGYSEARIWEQLNQSTLIGLLQQQGNMMGYFFVTIPESQLHHQSLLWIDACCIYKTLQSKGLYARALAILYDIYQYQGFGWLGLRTQNPVMMHLIDKMNANDLYPFDKYYDSEIINYLIDNVYEARKPYLANRLELHTAICKKVYAEGRLGKYPDAIDKGRTSYFETKLKSFQFERDAGDAIILLKKL